MITRTEREICKKEKEGNENRKTEMKTEMKKAPHFPQWECGAACQYSALTKRRKASMERFTFSVSTQ